MGYCSFGLANSFCSVPARGCVYLVLLLELRIFIFMLYCVYVPVSWGMVSFTTILVFCCRVGSVLFSGPTRGCWVPLVVWVSPDCLLVRGNSTNLVRGMVYRMSSVRSLLFG